MKRVVYRTVLLLLLLLPGLSGCGLRKAGNRDYTLESTEAVTLPFPGNAVETSNLLKEKCTVWKSNYSQEKAELYEQAIANGEWETEPYTFYSVWDCAANKNGAYYVREWDELMAQNPYAYQIYRHNEEKEDDSLLYEAPEVYLLNEFYANDSCLYWVEYKFDPDEYWVMQYDLATDEAKCLAVRPSGEWYEICLSVNNNYVTWYDHNKDGSVNIAVYNVQDQELEVIQDESIIKYMPYERLPVIDGGITYFTGDKEDRIFVNRYQLDTRICTRLLLGNKSVWPKLAGCFSDSAFLGWYTDYSTGTYYFYNMENGELWCLESSKDLRIFSECLLDGKFCFYNSANEKIYTYDLTTQDAMYQVLPDTGLLTPCDDELYIKALGGNGYTIYNIQYTAK